MHASTPQQKSFGSQLPSEVPTRVILEQESDKPANITTSKALNNHQTLFLTIARGWGLSMMRYGRSESSLELTRQTLAYLALVYAVHVTSSTETDSCVTCSTDTDPCVTCSKKYGFYKLRAAARLPH